MMNGKKALVTDELRATKVRGPEGTRRFIGDIRATMSTSCSAPRHCLRPEDENREDSRVL